MRPYVRLTKVLIRYRLRVSLSVYSESTTGVDSAYIFPILALHTLSSLPPPPLFYATSSSTILFPFLNRYGTRSTLWKWEGDVI